MTMIPFQLHLRRCDVCRRWTKTPCVKGYELFEKGVAMVTWASMIRAKA